MAHGNLFTCPVYAPTKEQYFPGDGSLPICTVTHPRHPRLLRYKKSSRQNEAEKMRDTISSIVFTANLSTKELFQPTNPKLPGYAVAASLQTTPALTTTV